MSVKEQVLQAIQRLPDDANQRRIAEEMARLLDARASMSDCQELLADSPRPSGLCAGEFVTPADFDAPLPADILRDFETA